MSDLFAFGLEPQHSSTEEDCESEESDEAAEPEDPDWPACVDCGTASYEVRQRAGQSIPLCPSCFADREGLR